MFPRQFSVSPGLFFFQVIFLYLVCLHFTAGTQNACHDLLTGASRIRAMLHNEQTDQFYLLTSSGHIFIEPISSFDPSSSPPNLKLTQAKYSMPTEFNHPETIKADNEEYLTFWVNPDKPSETLLSKVWRESNQICVYPGVKLAEERAQVEKITRLCYTKHRVTSPHFWLSFNSKSYGMVSSFGLYCRAYLFPDDQRDDTLSQSSHRRPWKVDSECLGLTLGGGKPQCGVVHKAGNVAVVIEGTSTVYVYRNILSSSDKNRLAEKGHIYSWPQPTSHQINKFIQCGGIKTKTDPSDVNLKAEQPGVNQQKPGKPKLDTPMKGNGLFLIILGVLLLAAFVLGLVVKFKLIQAFPWKRKRTVKGKTLENLISQAYSTAISMAIIKAPVVARESALQRILQKAASVDKAQEKQAHTTSTPGVVTKMLTKMKKRLVNSVKAAKKPKKKMKKKIRKRKGR